MPVLVEIKNLTVEYDGDKVLDDISLDVNEGEIFGIVGTSGAGKTSLTNILTGNLEPTGGMVEMKVGDEWINMCEPGYYARAGPSPISACSTRNMTCTPIVPSSRT